MFQWLQKTETRPSPVHAQCQCEIRRQTATLISVANRAESFSQGCAQLESTSTLAVQASQSLIAAQNALAEALIDGFACGLSFERLIEDGIQPALDAGVVTDLAALSVQTTLESARERLDARLKGRVL